MRILGRLLFLAILMPLLAWGVWPIWNASLGLISDREPGNQLDKVDRTVAYELDRERWTIFPLVGGRDRVRLVTQAALPIAAVEGAGLGTDQGRWTYAIAYEIVAADGRVLAEGLRHALAAVEICRDPLTGDLASSVAYIEERLQPTLAKVTVLDLSEQPEAAKIRLRFISLDPKVDHVIARVYEREPLAEFRAQSSWQRLSEGQRERLAAEVGLPVALLDNAEQLEVLRNRWHPVGPQGLEGKDYLVRALYVWPGGCDDPVAEPTLAPGFYADALRHAIIQFPPDAEGLVLSFEPPFGEDAGAEAGMLELRWHGPVPGLPLVTRARWSMAEGALALPVRGAALEVIPDRPLVLHARSSGQSASGTEIDFRPLHLRMVQATAEAPVTFPVTHVGGEPTPFRLHLRCLCGAEETVPAPRRVDYEFLGTKGEVVGAGSLEAALGPAPLEQVPGDPSLRVLGPAFAHFNLPLSVRAIRVSGPQPYLVAASNRPPDMPVLAAMIAPEAEPVAEEVAPREARVWFPLRPIGWKEFVEGDGSTSLVVQERVVPDETALLFQRLNWEPWEPDVPLPRVEILSPFNRRPGLLSTFSGDIFVPLAAGRPHFFDFLPASGAATVEPELLFLSPAAEPTEVRITLDGQLARAQEVAGPGASLRLPPFAPRWHSVEARWSGSGRLMIGQVDPTTQAWVRRRAIRLGAGEGVSLSFDKRQEGREFLVIHVHPEEVGGRGRLEVELGIGPRRVGPLSDWTSGLWRADLDGASGTGEGFLQRSGEQLGTERTVVVPFGADLLPGTYDLRLRLEGLAGYLAFTRSGPDLAAQVALGEEGTIGAMNCGQDAAGAWSCGAALP
ncbi:hypothetical protein EF888_19925 [Silicimonas algicola]|uniref:Uncharacterized protein n=1 Tax=Silicimonas algicola TaxID=1826607 RepID=A0A316GJK2_9RHOB|nr:hypothetical protein [Silicimonas algicola]AZQ69200.1 hypothetical protein EF888_19925 [Silicimonas algicola]PWK54987.1 hypothetical protein C8D95_10974 [Silicimonas algicola]